MPIAPDDASIEKSINSHSFYPSETFTVTYLNMRQPF